MYLVIHPLTLNKYEKLIEELDSPFIPPNERIVYVRRNPFLFGRGQRFPLAWSYLERQLYLLEEENIILYCRHNKRLQYNAMLRTLKELCSTHVVDYITRRLIIVSNNKRIIYHNPVRPKHNEGDNNDAKHRKSSRALQLSV